MKWILVAALAALAGGCGVSQPELVLYIWEDYLGPDTVGSFERANGCRVVVHHVASGSELRAKLLGGQGGYDVVVPSEEDLAILSGAGVLEAVDAAKLPNLKHLAARFRADARHGVPYMWGTTGIAVNTEKIKAKIDSWGALWDPANKPMSMLEDPIEVFAAALRLEGKSVRTADEAAVVAARDRLAAQKAHLVPYNSQPRGDLAAGTLWLAQCYSGDALQAAKDAPISFVIPKEGGTIWVDFMAVPKSAKRKDLAWKFLDHVLDPRVSGAIATTVKYANCNEAAREHTDPSVLSNPIAYPPESDLARCERFRDLDPVRRQRIEDAWAEVRRK